MATRAEWAKEVALWIVVLTILGLFYSPIWTGVCFVWNPIWTILSNVPVVYWKDPLFQSGNTIFDNLLALSVYFVTIIVTLEIATIICKAKTLAVEEEENNLPKQRKVNWTAFRYWIVAAVAITILVNLQRYEHRQLKLKFFEMLGEKQRGEEWYKESKVKKYFPGFLKWLFDDGIHPHFYAKVPRSLSHSFPHMPADSSRAASVWGYLKLLVENSRSLWWTRQWFLGWMAWCVYVRIECWKRNIDRSVAADFVLVGYTMSLAGAQCLFFALLLVYPKRAERKTRLKSIYLVTSTFAEGLLLVVVPWVLVWEEKSRADWLPGTHWTFMVVQVLLFITPLFVLRSEAVLSPRSRVITGRSRGGQKSQELDVKKLWHALSIIAIVLHILGTYFAFAEVNRDSWWGHSNGWPRQVNWFAPWRNESDAAVQEFKQVGVSIFETLSDHPCINALGWDVLLSVVVLSTWSAFSSTGTREMIRCSVSPGLEDGGEEPARSTRGTFHQPSRTTRSAKLHEDTQETGRRAGRYGRSLRRTNEATRIPDAGRAEEDQSLWTQEEEAAGEAEAAGLTWCLWVLGGLGTASAAVFGANQQEI